MTWDLLLVCRQFLGHSRVSNYLELFGFFSSRRISLIWAHLCPGTPGRDWVFSLPPHYIPAFPLVFSQAPWLLPHLLYLHVPLFLACCSFPFHLISRLLVSCIVCSRNLSRTWGIGLDLLDSSGTCICHFLPHSSRLWHQEHLVREPHPPPSTLQAGVPRKGQGGLPYLDASQVALLEPLCASGDLSLPLVASLIFPFGLEQSNILNGFCFPHKLG